ncbi:hypothetical protein BBP40_005696 [Aspergillus hancockii]|nr:hypothetical protein BBP40_005696 [Aspergillus hancockii]
MAPNFNRTPGPRNPTETVAALLTKYKASDTYAYERNETWYLGLGSQASLLINSNGTEYSIYEDGKEATYLIDQPLPDLARKFVSEHSTDGHRIFGQAGFNYAAHIRGQDYPSGKWPILTLMVPRVNIRLDRDSASVKGPDHREVEKLHIFLKNNYNLNNTIHPQPVDTKDSSGEYINRVEKALSEIDDGEYTKVILSRAVELKNSINMPATLLRGRRSNAPARTFSLNHAGFQATGFSPELVMSAQNGMVTTEPLVGTRSRIGSEEEVEKLSQELLSDPKEMKEHVVLVREAINELERVCPAESVKVDDFMSVRLRGSVQHLGSRVSGCLKQEKDVWDAFGELFPSITASGIPKAAALESIQRLEPQPRELYSGAVLMLEGSQTMEAALVLRSVFQNENHQWIQAGAGVISQSKAERELSETREKLSSIALFVVTASES